MATEPQFPLRLEIRHVLFIDLVGHSRVLSEAQRERDPWHNSRFATVLKAFR